jgi:hypothetical protein
LKDRQQKHVKKEREYFVCHKRNQEWSRLRVRRGNRLLNCRKKDKKHSDATLIRLIREHLEVLVNDGEWISIAGGLRGAAFGSSARLFVTGGPGPASEAAWVSLKRLACNKAVGLLKMANWVRWLWFRAGLS